MWCPTWTTVFLSLQNPILICNIDLTSGYFSSVNIVFCAAQAFVTVSLNYYRNLQLEQSFRCCYRCTNYTKSRSLVFALCCGPGLLGFANFKSLPVALGRFHLPQSSLDST